MMAHSRYLAATFAAALSTSAAESHEFWIEAEDYTVAPGENVVATIRVGETFEGSSYAYLPHNFERFDMAQGDAVAPIGMRAGDRPAVDVPAPGEGLIVLLHVTRDYRLDWESWQDFADFVEHKDAGWVLEAHAARGLPRDVLEGYSRYGKALVAVGEGAGADRAFGLLTEIVALENPYTGDMSDGLDVKVLYQGVPRADAQVEIFARDAGGAVTVTATQTDAGGRATVPVAPGRIYLLDAVVLREPSTELAAAIGGVQWESLWASLTFAVPD